MAEKHEQGTALAPATTMENIKIDEESATIQPKELKKKKRVKCAVYIVVFAIFQTLVITGLALTVMKIKTPTVQFGSVTVQELTTTGSVNGTDPTVVKARFTSQLTVKNTNFGHYEWEANTASFYYGSEAVGTVAVPSGRVRARSSKRMGVTVSVDSSELKDTARLGADLGSGILTLTSRAELSGEVKLMKVIKKKRNAKLDCTVSFDVSAKTVQDLKCK